MKYSLSSILSSLRMLARSPWTPWIIGILGAFFRITTYFKNHSLWLDEAFLAFNVLNRDFAQLMQPLVYDQAAPIGFLFLTKAATLVLGNTEYALRLVPLLFGVASLPLFYWVARRLLPQGTAVLAFFLYSFCFHLIRYGAEFKQYVSDAAIAIVLLYAYLKWNDHRPRWSYAWIFFLIGLAAISVSQSAILILAGLGAAHAMDIGLRGKATEKWQCCLVFIPLAIVFFTLLLTVYKSTADNSFLHKYWVNGFIPFPPKSPSDIQWYLNQGFELFRDPLGFELHGLAAFSFFLGLLGFYRRERKFFAILGLPLFMAILASILGKYPLEGRVAIYLIPIGLLLVAKGVEELRTSLASKKWPIHYLVIALLCLHPTFYAFGRSVWAGGFQEYRPVFTQMASLRKTQEPIYVFCGAVPSFQFYAPKFGLNQGPIVADTNFKPTWPHYDKVISEMQNAPKVWFVFGHYHFDRSAVDYFRYQLDKIGAREETLIEPGVTAFSYRFPK